MFVLHLILLLLCCSRPDNYSSLLAVKHIRYWTLWQRWLNQWLQVQSRCHTVIRSGFVRQHFDMFKWTVPTWWTVTRSEMQIHFCHGFQTVICLHITVRDLTLKRTGNLSEKGVDNRSIEILANRTNKCDNSWGGSQPSSKCQLAAGKLFGSVEKPQMQNC